MAILRSRPAAIVVTGLVALAAAGSLEAAAMRAGFNASALTRNDDGSSITAVPIGFPVDFFGQVFATAWVNNNGNITFTGPLSTFTPFPLSTTATRIIAPFFADVDTRNTLSDVTRYGAGTVNGRPAWGVTWLNVGYYSSKADKRNSFQLVLIDMSSVTGQAGDFDIEFNYDAIKWETGEASGGTGGLGGSSARAGFSNGTAQSGTFLELPGSAVNGGLLDTNTSTGLIRRSLPPGSVPLGRYTFPVRGGRPVLADLSVSSTVSPTWSSGNLTYVFTVDHLGDGDPATPVDPTATGVRLVNQLPANIDFVSVSPAPLCAYTANNRTIACDVGIMSPGATFSATIVTQPTAPGGTFLINTATVSSNEADPNPANNSVTARTNANDPDVTVTPCNPTLVPPSVTEGSACVFTIAITRQTPLEVRVNYATAQGTAVAGTDFTSASGTVTFTANTTTLTKTVSVATTNDTLDEDPETFSFSVTSAANANLSPTQRTATVQINDNDNAPSVKVSDCSVVEGVSGNAPCVLTVGLYNGTNPAVSGRMVSVDYLISDGTATIADSDYAAVSTSGTLSFTPGKQSLEVLVYSVGDANVETHETVNVALSNLVNLCVTSCAHDLNAAATILNDDGPVIAIGDVTVTEGASANVNATYTLTLTPASAQSVVVTYYTRPLTATGNVDYTTVTNGTVTFTAGQTLKTFNIVVRHDLVDEPTEIYQVVLNPATYASIPDPVADGYILDNDGATTGLPAELSHGSAEVYDLASPVPASPDVDWFMMALAPYASYEVVVDGISGDMTDSTTPFRVRRLAADQTTVLLPNSVAVGRGEARALRWTNGATADATQWIRVESAASGVACDVDCGADDRYRVRFFETTASVPRFNNSGGQVTILLLQNLLDTGVDATAYFWDPNGVLLGSQALILAARETRVLNTGTVPGTTGQSGAITIAHTAGYGGLSGKTVALDPANGFAFDTPLVYLPR